MTDRDRLIQLPDGSWVRPSAIRSIVLRPATRFAGLNSLDGVVIDVSGVLRDYDMPGPDEARAEADRLAALVNASSPSPTPAQSDPATGS